MSRPWIHYQQATAWDGRQASTIPFSWQSPGQVHRDQMIIFIAWCQDLPKLSRSWKTLVYVGRDSWC